MSELKSEEAIDLASEINLESPDDTTLFDDEEDIKIEFVNFEFAQVSKIRGTELEITVFNDTQCHHKISRKGKGKHKYRVDISFLDSKPFRRRVIATRWAYAAGGAFVVTLMAAFAGFFETGSALHVGTSVGFLLISLFLVLMTVHHSRNRVVFRSKHGKVKLLELFNNNPDKASFKAFIDQFSKQIEAASKSRNLPLSSLLAKEIQELRRLRDERVIPAAAYERAKKILFRHEAYRASE